MDTTSHQILRAFQEDGRASFVDVAERLGVAEGTIRRKYARLVESGVLKIAGVVDPLSVGYQAPAIIGVKLRAQRLEQVMDEVAKLRRVHFVAATTGAYDLIIMAVLKDTDELYQLITKHLSVIEGITSVETLLILKTHKQSFDWLDPHTETEE